MESLVEAAYSRESGWRWPRPIAPLEVARHLWRLAPRTPCDPALNRYEHGARLMDELGRQIGVVLRSFAEAGP
ncbi:MAG: hypothetical protein IPK63_23475 [Candidatus Competibacteraceae bacterium]|nr:hypothetical protein [Candidatus Competibacteraceae bacterium]